MEKTIFKSKTALVQVLTIIASFIPVVQQWLVENPALVLSILATVNLLVRFFTSKKVILFPVSTNSVFSVLLIVGASMAVFTVLPSCSTLSQLPEGANFKVFKRFDDGAKAGLHFRDGSVSGFGRKTFLDDQGNVMFEVEVENELQPRSQVNAEK